MSPAHRLLGYRALSGGGRREGDLQGAKTVKAEDETLRYGAAACQVDFPNPAHRRGIKRHVDRMLQMIDQAVEGYGPFLPSPRPCASSPPTAPRC